MAEVQRRRTLVNPARRKGKRKNPKRKLSPKQIAIFGTPRQKAALKASRKRKRTAGHAAKRNPSSKRAAPRRTKRAGSRHRAKRRNPGGIIEVALNPAPPKRRRMAKKRKSSSKRRRSNTKHRRTNPAPAARRSTRRRSTGKRRATRRRSVRRNPSMGGVSNLIVSAGYAIAGAVGSKYLTQMVLGASNVGYVGYGANLAASFIAGKVVGMVTKNKQAENSVILGGVIMTVVRILGDQTPLGETLKQYGLGDYEASTWLSPARYIDGAKSAAVDIPTALRPQIVSKGAGMSGLKGMGGGTYAAGRGTY